MKTNKFWTVLSKALAVITVTLVTALILAPSAWAASKYKVLYKFTGGADGSQPYAGLIFDASGNLYGTTYQGGPSGDGTVFKLTKNSEKAGAKACYIVSPAAPTEPAPGLK
jgi:uncharacterized repeat protein (TIGR03803 family)